MSCHNEKTQKCSWMRLCGLRAEGAYVRWWKGNFVGQDGETAKVKKF